MSNSIRVVDVCKFIARMRQEEKGMTPEQIQEHRERLTQEYPEMMERVMQRINKDKPLYQEHEYHPPIDVPIIDDNVPLIKDDIEEEEDMGGEGEPLYQPQQSLDIPLIRQEPITIGIGSKIKKSHAVEPGQYKYRMNLPEYEENDDYDDIDDPLLEEMWGDKYYFDEKKHKIKFDSKYKPEMKREFVKSILDIIKKIRILASHECNVFNRNEIKDTFIKIRELYNLVNKSSQMDYWRVDNW
jgi:hypothetical protein